MLKVPKGISVARVARAADMSHPHLYELMRPSVPVRQSTLARLKAAIIRIRTGEEKGTGRGHALYRSLLVVAATEMGLDPVSVQMTDPRATKMRNERWLELVFVHAVARALMVTVFGFKQVEVARELGLTRAAISKSVKQVADREDSDQAFAAAMDNALRKLLGESI
jgi:DNA-binding phage protein